MTNTSDKKSGINWLLLFCLFIGGGVINGLTWNIRSYYYLPLQHALGVNNTQFGVMLSVYGIACMICYFPGGWLADRFSARKLLTFSFITTGLGGLYFSTFPSYRVSLLLHIFWGITNTLTYWAAFIKATRQIASPDNQGKAFGILEGGRGLTVVVIALFTLAIFSKLGGNTNAIRWVVLIYSFINILVGLMTWVLFKDTKEEAPQGELWKSIVTVVKIPMVWLISLIILCAYVASSGSQFFTPYTSQVFGASVVVGALLGIMRDWVRPVAGVAAGYMGDNIGNGKGMLYSFVVLIIGLVLFAILPGKHSLLILMVINMVLVSLAIYATRALYYALLEEGNISMLVTGTAVGLICTVAYSPDIYIPVICGHLLDTYPGALGYKYIFLLLAGCAAIGLLATIYFVKITKAKREAILASKKAA